MSLIRSWQQTIGLGGAAGGIFKGRGRSQLFPTALRSKILLYCMLCFRSEGKPGRGGTWLLITVLGCQRQGAVFEQLWPVTWQAYQQHHYPR